MKNHSFKSVAHGHFLRICADNVRFPLKAKFVGGPTPEEAEAALKAAGWSEKRLAAIRPAATVKEILNA